MNINHCSFPIDLQGNATFVGGVLTVGGGGLKCLNTYTDSISKATLNELHGGLDAVVTGGVLTTIAPINTTVGLSRVLLVVNGGGDTSGQITLTGTSVDRDTGTETGSDTEVIEIDGVTTDGSTAGTELATLYSFTDAYISAKWWKGALTLSTATPFVALSDLDVYSIAFEQFNSSNGVTVHSIDNTLYAESVASDFELQAYKVQPTGTPTAAGCDVLQVTNMLQTSPSLNLFYRLRRGQLATTIAGADGEGFFIQAKVGNSRTWTNWNCKVWYDIA